MNTKHMHHLIPFVSCVSFLLTQTAHADDSKENTSVQQLETMTFTASRADGLQEKSKQTSKIDEKQLELLKQG